MRRAQTLGHAARLVYFETEIRQGKRLLIRETQNFGRRNFIDYSEYDDTDARQRLINAASDCYDTADQQAISGQLKH